MPARHDARRAGHRASATLPELEHRYRCTPCRARPFRLSAAGGVDVLVPQAGDVRDPAESRAFLSIQRRKSRWKRGQRSFSSGRDRCGTGHGHPERPSRTGCWTPGALVGATQRQLLYECVGVMLIVVAPVIVLTLAFRVVVSRLQSTGGLPAGLELQRQGRVLDLDHPVADRSLPGGGGLGQLARAGSVSTAGAGPQQAAARGGGRHGLEMAVRLSRAGRGQRQRTCSAPRYAP